MVASVIFVALFEAALALSSSTSSTASKYLPTWYLNPATGEEEFQGAECSETCSSWDDVNWATKKVCQSTIDPSKCTSEKKCYKDGGTEPIGEMCKQKPIAECFLFCEGYATSQGEATDENSLLVCQNIDVNAHGNDFGVCFPLPCSAEYHKSSKYSGVKVCKQTLPQCLNPCGRGSDEPNSTSVCYDQYSDSCENHDKECPVHMVRCTPTKYHQNLGNEAKSKGDAWLETSGKAHLLRSDAPRSSMTQEEWRDEQQRWKINALREQQQKETISRTVELKSGGAQQVEQ